MVYENPRPVYPNELYHHGIFGQHWGETNGPPYPLGSGTHNRVVRQGRAERKENKRAFINARNAYEEKAFMYKDALAGAKKAERQAAKLERKASKNSAYSQQAKAARTNANAMNRRADFYKTGHDTFYKAYKEAAAKAGKKARYTGDDRFSITGRNINSASSKALTRGNNMGAYTGQAAYLASVLAGLSNPVTLGLTLGSGIAGRAYDIKGMSNRTKQLRAQERDIESRFAKQLSAAKSEYKTQRASGPRHTGNSVSSERTNAVNYLVRYGIPKATAQKVVSGKDKDSLADMMKDAYKNPQLLTMGANKLSAAQLERHLYG